MKVSDTLTEEIAELKSAIVEIRSKSKSIITEAVTEAVRAANARNDKSIQTIKDAIRDIQSKGDADDKAAKHRLELQMMELKSLKKELIAERDRSMTETNDFKQMFEDAITQRESAMTAERKLRQKQQRETSELMEDALNKALLSIDSMKLSIEGEKSKVVVSDADRAARWEKDRQSRLEEDNKMKLAKAEADSEAAKVAREAARLKRMKEEESSSALKNQLTAELEAIDKAARAAKDEEDRVKREREAKEKKRAALFARLSTLGGEGESGGAPASPARKFSTLG
jgi:hypothetical protein